MTMKDRCGLALTTDSVEASDCFVEATDRVFALRSGAHPLLEAALAVEDEFAVGHGRCSACSFGPAAVFAYFTGLHDGR